MSIEFIDFLPASNILKIDAKNKKDALDKLINFTAQNNNIDKERLHSAIWKRENQLSTALGHGLAIPHARLEEVEQDIIITLGVCSKKIDDYKGIDKKAVSLIFLIISNNKKPQLYLDVLKSVSIKLFTHTKLIKKIVEYQDDYSKIKELLNEY